MEDQNKTLKIMKYEITGVKCSTICRHSGDIESEMYIGSMYCRDKCKYNEGTHHPKYQVVCSHPEGE